MIQVWTPPHYGMRPESFIFDSHHVSADLWHGDPQWMPMTGTATTAPVVEEAAMAMAGY